MFTIETTYEEVKEILKLQHCFFHNQNTKDIEFRLKQLHKLRSAVKEYEKKIEIALYEDLGKHPCEVYETEVGFVLHSINEAMRQLKKWMKPERVKTPLYLFPAKSEIITEPLGSVLIIAPFNYPFQLIMEPLIGAMAAGNCIVLKPSEDSPATSCVIQEIIQSIFKKEYIYVMRGGMETGEALIKSPFDHIFFTGSESVGKKVMESASNNLVPVTLELGGKSPVIVDETANIHIAAKRIIWGKTLNAGQTCVAPDYMLVSKSVKEKLIETMIQVLNHFYGQNVEQNDHFGKIINEKHFQRLLDILNRDRQGIRYGGLTIREKRFISPTIIDVDLLKDPACMREELFGPILPVLSYDNVEDAIKLIQAKPKPLALYLFTENKQTQREVLKQISCGGICINDTISHLANTKLPFGGVGHSGMGKYHGYETYLNFSNRKSVMKKPCFIDIPILYPPFTEKKIKWMKRLFR